LAFLAAVCATGLLACLERATCGRQATGSSWGDIGKTMMSYAGLSEACRFGRLALRL
jgi:hypothetical protein